MLVMAATKLRDGVNGEPVFQCPVCSSEMVLHKPSRTLNCFMTAAGAEDLPEHSPMSLNDYNLMMRRKVYGIAHPFAAQGIHR